MADTYEFDMSGLPPSYRLGKRLPTLDAMIHIRNYWIALCPECGGHLQVYQHEGRPALTCWRCELVWPTKAYPSICGQRDLVRQYMVNPDQIVPRQAKEAA